MYFFDESGFTLDPYVPYAWQNKGERIEVPSSSSKRLNVLGFISRDCKFTSFVFEESINTSCVVATFDKFSLDLDKKTVVLIDNASMHTSREFVKNIEKWEKRGMFIMYNAPYSPELNIIEVLWKQIKYKWLPFSAYDSFNNLKTELFYILKNIGEQFTIRFS